MCHSCDKTQPRHGMGHPDPICYLRPKSQLCIRLIWIVLLQNLFFLNSCSACQRSVVSSCSCGDPVMWAGWMEVGTKSDCYGRLSSQYPGGWLAVGGWIDIPLFRARILWRFCYIFGYDSFSTSLLSQLKCSTTDIRHVLRFLCSPAYLHHCHRRKRDYLEQLFRGLDKKIVIILLFCEKDRRFLKDQSAWGKESTQRDDDRWESCAFAGQFI